MADIRIETERLILRPPQKEDLQAWITIGADNEVMQHLGGMQPPLTAWRSFMANVGAWHMQGFAPFAVIEKATGTWIGRIGPLCPETWPGTEIGWTLARHAWGRGYAVEAAKAAMDWAFVELGWTDVVHCIAPTNTASQAVAARLGSRKRGPFLMPAPHQNDPIELWGQTRDEWRARSR